MSAEGIDTLLRTPAGDVQPRTAQSLLAAWANTPGSEQTAAIINQGGTTPPAPIAQFSTHSHMTYRSIPHIVEQSRLAPPP